MQTIHCKQITNHLQSILALKKEFDDNVVKSNLQKVIELQDKIIHEENLGLEALQEFYWPVENFPRIELMTGGDTAEEIQVKLHEVCEQDNERVNISSDTQFLLDSMYKSEEFADYRENPRIVKLIRVKVGDLGFLDATTIDQVYAMGAKLGLSLCPAEVGPYLRLKDTDQPVNDSCPIAMRQIISEDGEPRIFELWHHDKSGFWLTDDGGGSTSIDKWRLNDEIIFCLSEFSTSKAKKFGGK